MFCLVSIVFCPAFINQVRSHIEGSRGREGRGGGVTADGFGVEL